MYTITTTELYTLLRNHQLLVSSPIDDTLPEQTFHHLSYDSRDVQT